MKKFFLQYRKRHWWLLADLAALGAFFLARGNRRWMNALSAGVTVPLRRFLGRVFNRVDWSVMEVLCGALAALTVGYLLWSAVGIVRAKGRRGQRAYSALLGAVCAAVTLYVGFCALWGIDSAADGFQEKSGITARMVSVEELDAVTRYFAARLSETADGVTRNSEGIFAENRADILEKAPQAYEGIEARFPFLAFDAPCVKPVRFSRVMSALDFTGVYCPFTGEANVNVDSPACLLPATAAHELAHQRGVTSEQECNFLAVLASTSCGDAAYAYSGWLSGYLYLGNALYQADETRWSAVWAALPETVKADLRAQNAYWAQFESGVARKVSNKVYDQFLKSYGQEQGLKSYGTVVDLLVVYYRDLAAA